MTTNRFEQTPGVNYRGGIVSEVVSEILSKVWNELRAIVQRYVEAFRGIVEFIRMNVHRYRFENGQPVRNEQYKPLLKNGGKP